MREEVYVIMSGDKYLYLEENENDGGKISLKWLVDPLEAFLFQSVDEIKEFIKSSNLLTPNFIVNDNRKVITFPRVESITIQKIKLSLFNIKDTFIDDLNTKNKFALQEYDKAVERLLNVSDEVISDIVDDTE